MQALRERTILLALAGSHAHGTATPASDIDISGIAVPTRRQALGLFCPFEQENDAEVLAMFHSDLQPDEQTIARRTKLEGTVFDLRKCVSLATAANPNILEVLFCRDEEVRRLHPLGERLREHAHLFVTERCRHTFGGYAASQLGRIQRHHRWHHDGPQAPPDRASFDLPEETLVPRAHLHAVEAAIRTRIDRWEVDLSDLQPAQRIDLNRRMARVLAEQSIGDDERWVTAARWIGLNDNFIEVMRRERKWRTARNEWKRYRSWLKNRNPVRAALEAEHGFDTKHGAHLVRLLRMGIEIVTTGRVNVWRGDRDADELTAIRNGAWSYEQLCEWTEQAQERLDDAPHTLPTKPDHEAIDALNIDLVEAGFALGGTA